MTSLADALAKPTSPKVGKAESKNLTNQIEVRGDVVEATINRPAFDASSPEGEARDLLEKYGLNPELYIVSGFRSSEWTMAGGGLGKSSRFTFALKGSKAAEAVQERPPIDDMIARIKKHRPKAKRADGDHGFLVLLGDMQFGKALWDETPTLTTDGWKRHGDIIPGDFVYGPEGKPVKVLAVTGSTEQELYRVEFDRGVGIIASGDHEWVGVRKFHPSGHKDGGPTWEWREQRLTTDELLGINNRPLNVRLTAPVEMPARDLLINPYILGLWLGDGNRTTGIISTDARDTEIYALGEPVPSNERNGVASVRVPGLTSLLNVSGLLGNKHIPEDYLRGSVEQRLALLQGLMDTDGSVTPGGTAEFSNTNESIADGVQWLLSSLGFKFTVSKGVGKLNGVEHLPFWRISFATRPDLSVFRFARKAARQRTTPAQDQATLRQVRQVVQVGWGQAQCLTVEGGLYLAGHELVITHNCDGDGAEGTLQRGIDGLNKAADLLEWHRKRFDIGHVHIGWLGDHVEGFQSQGGANVWRTQLTLSEQMRLSRRLMEHAMELFAPLCTRLTMAAVPGNHGETTRFAGKGVTRYDDSHDTEGLIALSEAAKYNPKAFGHVEFYVPDTDEMTVVLDVAGTTVAHVHGHQFRSGKHLDWWQGQDFGGGAIRGADVLVAGHLHHELVEEQGWVQTLPTGETAKSVRTFIQTPALESESTWWRHAKGVTGSPGLIVGVTKDGLLRGLEVVR